MMTLKAWSHCSFLALALVLASGTDSTQVARAQNEPLRCTTTRDKTVSPTTIRLGERVKVKLEVGGNCPTRELKADVVLVIDRSRSMSNNGKLTAAKQAAKDFVDRIDPQYIHVGVIAFNSIAETMHYLTDDVAALKQAIDDIQITPRTNLVDSLDAGRRMVTSAGARPDATPVIVFMTDGNHSVQTPAENEIFRVIAQIRTAGITTYAIGLGNDADHALLRQIAGDPSRYYFSPTGSVLADIFLKIAGRIEASVLFKEIIIDDIVPANMRYIAGSSVPPAIWDPATRTLSWTLVDIADTGAELSYELQPTQTGTHPTNVEAKARYKDGFDEEGQIIFPIPIVNIIPGEPAECVCRITRQKAPVADIDYALSHPEKIWGWNMLLDPNKPGSPPYPTPGYDSPPNPRRVCLDIWHRAIHYHPLFNSVVWRAGCLEGPARP